ncbi:unnamed protein product [Ceutorhynchus assimilis]|uniref:SURF1-like protein n=1 Tax=Ceutorhynchus assimilis TaxID=467358 RepID=A0A9N9MUY1_9CUCU|nr:unnamed protein product [Ceutorhynchus assimilis]
MNFVLKTLRSNSKVLFRDNAVLFSTNSCLRQGHKPLLRKEAPSYKKVHSYGWIMLVIPAASFGLGVWQIQRKSWKEELIEELQEKSASAPIELPTNLDELQQLEYRPVIVRGTFLHDKEIYMGPRSIKEDKHNSSLFSEGGNQGYLVVTPFKLADRDETILVNRGWVPAKNIKPASRARGQVEGDVNVIGIVRLNENRPNFAMKNKEGSNLYFYRDLNSMCASTGASPIFLDQTIDYNAPGGPIGGQTRVTLRNEHLSYVITWFSLGAVTSYMWYRMYLKPR